MDILGGDPAVYGQYFSELVQTSVEPVYPIANYGSAMAPFYSVLAIWVGGVILVALMKVHAKTDGCSIRSRGTCISAATSRSCSSTSCRRR